MYLNAGSELDIETKKFATGPSSTARGPAYYGQPCPQGTEWIEEMVDQRRPARVGLVEASRTAMAQMAELTGATAASVSELARLDGGFRMHVEIVELERVPPSTSILATYEVDADGGGNVTSYRRVRRYLRSEAGEL
jgi:hypothetical protein